MHQTAIVGKEAESAVCERLIREGYAVLDRNWRRPWGELDIVAERSGVISFIEVKASRQMLAGFAPTVRADRAKMSRVLRTARTWLAAHRLGDDTEWRLLVASVIMDHDDPAIEFIPYP